MSDVEFYRTKAGRQFYEGTMPELVKQLARLNENLERMATGTSPAVERLVAAAERVLETEIVPGSKATRAAFDELRAAIRAARAAEPGA